MVEKEASLSSANGGTTANANDSAAPQPNTPPETEAVLATHKSQDDGTEGASQRQKHLHRKKSNKRRVALPVSGSSGPATPVPLNNPDGEAVKVAQDREVQNEALPTGEGRKSQVTFLRQVLGWVRDERHRQRDRAARREARKAEKKSQGSPSRTQSVQQEARSTDAEGIPIPERKTRGIDENLAPESPNRTESIESTSSAAGASTDSLNRLEQIARAGLAASSSSLRLAGQATGSPRVASRQPSRKALRQLSRPTTSYTSDTDYAPEGDVVVPECEVALGMPEKIGWDSFKDEVLKLTHTLRCKGWRRISLDRYKELEIKRMSGGFTNAVYMVSPPPVGEPIATNGPSPSTKKPAKLLLRLYGAQVSHLIDRDTELSILRRLARKKIGPRLLGTFQNGRFEQFFNAETLTKDDIRNPDTSRQIAKRMRELHENVELQEAEIKAGPIVWINWDRWIGRAREIMKDVEAQDPAGGILVAWTVFEGAVEKYRKWLVARHGGEEEVRKQLVFAHNDTQYGNILRMIPTEDSPVLLPMNTHRQLVVIDFEYASANLPEFEIANHFCEWMSNYLAPSAAHTMHESLFPTLQEQKNFVKAYVGNSMPRSHQVSPHSTYFNCSIPIPEPLCPDPRTPPPTTADPGQFMLDACTPTALTAPASSASSYKEEETARQGALEAEAERLREEARAWRPAVHAMWAAWCVVQAKIPSGEGEEGEGHKDERGGKSEEGDEEFDYLGHTQQRALLFWGDILSLGIMSEGEVKECFKGGGFEKIKRVEQ